MPLEDWEKVSREDPDYKACMKATAIAGTLVGSATGSFVPGAGTAAGALAGLAWGLASGYFLCPYLAPAIRKKIESGLSLSDDDVVSAAEAMGRYAQVHKAADAVKLVALVKHVTSGGHVTVAHNTPELAAKHILERLALKGRFVERGQRR